MSDMSGTAVMVKEKSTNSPLRSESRSGRHENRTGIPMELKERMEQSTGVSLDYVRVNYNSSRPARLGALAYTMGNQVEIGPGQERHLPHELGHVIQQKLGIVRANARYPNGIPLNTDVRLERQADEIGSGKRITIIQRMSQDAVQRCGNKNMIQLRIDDVKIVADRCGVDPTFDANAVNQDAELTCHHVIPAEILEQFFNFCEKILNSYTQSNFRQYKKVKKGYEQWKATAVKSAKVLINRRQFPFGNNGNDSNEVSSACQWMAGNIFIGPDAKYRVDDQSNGFDRGGYRDKEKHDTVEQYLIKYDNDRLDELNKIYKSINNILEKFKNDENFKILKDKESHANEIIEVLEKLSDIATFETTLHESSDNFKNKTLRGASKNVLKQLASNRSHVDNATNKNTIKTYNVNDWVSIGKIPINGMTNEKDKFKRMYDCYIAIKEKGEDKSDLEKEFYESFKAKINIGRYEDNLNREITGDVLTLLTASNELPQQRIQNARDALLALKPSCMRTISYIIFKELYEKCKKVCRDL